MADTVRKVKKATCPWCGRLKRWRWPLRAECGDCEPRNVHGRHISAAVEAMRDHAVNEAVRVALEERKL